MKYSTASGKTTEFMFSANGSEWHCNRQAGDIYFRMRIHGFTWWSDAFKLTSDENRKKQIAEFLEAVKNG